MPPTKVLDILFVALMAHTGSEFIISSSAAGISPSSITMPETLPALAGSNAGAAGAAAGMSPPPSPPPPQATAAAITSKERTVHRFRCCIEILLNTYSIRLWIVRVALVVRPTRGNVKNDKSPVNPTPLSITRVIGV